MWASWGGVKASTDSPCEGLWIHECLNDLFGSFLVSCLWWRGLESRATAFRQMDIDYKITIFSLENMQFSEDQMTCFNEVWKQIENMKLWKKLHPVYRSIDLLWAAETFIWPLKASPALLKKLFALPDGGSVLDCYRPSAAVLGFSTSWETWQMDALCTHI